MTKNRPDLGKKVEFIAEAYKAFPDGKDITDRHWARREFDEPQHGLYIGYRFVYEGKWKSVTTHKGWDEDYFHRTGQHEVWLVVTNPRHNPIYVWPDDAVQIIE
jgi:hypothetical protein